MIQLIYYFLYRFSLDIVNFPIKQTKELDTSETKLWSLLQIIICYIKEVHKVPISKRHPKIILNQNIQDKHWTLCFWWTIIDGYFWSFLGKKYIQMYIKSKCGHSILLDTVNYRTQHCVGYISMLYPLYLGHLSCLTITH